MALLVLRVQKSIANHLFAKFYLNQIKFVNFKMLIKLTKKVLPIINLQNLTDFLFLQMELITIYSYSF